MSVDTSKSAGAEMVRFAVRFVPLTVKDCAAEARPVVVEKPTRLEGAADTKGNAATVPPRPTFCVAAPVLAIVRLPETGPAAALAEMRA